MTDELFIGFDNFFKVTGAYACFLFWNMNAIPEISIKSSYHISKAQPNTFSYGHPRVNDWIFLTAARKSELEYYSILILVPFENVCGIF